MKQPRIVIPDLFFLSLLLLLSLVSFVSYQRINSLNKAANLVSHTNKINLKLNEILINLINAETGQRGYLLTHDSTYLKPFIGSLEKTNQDIQEMELLTSNDTEEDKNLNILSSLIHNRFDILTENLSIPGVNLYSPSTLKLYLSKGKIIMDEIRERIVIMMNYENELLAKRTKQKEQKAIITPLYSLLFSLIALLILTIAYFKLRKEINLRIKAEDREAEIQKLHQVTLESEQRFRNIADTVPVLIWLSGKDKSCHFFNKAWLEFTGRTIDQETGNGWAEGVHPDDLNKCLDIYISSFDLRKEFYMEFRLKRYDGEYRWISYKGVPRYTPDGRFLGYAGGCMDIHNQKNFTTELETQVTERTEELRKINKELEIKNTIYAIAEENALVGSYSWNLQTGELEYSDNFFRLLGCEPQEFVPSFETFLGFIHPDDKKQVIEDGNQTWETKKLVEHLYRIITKKGEIKFCRSSGIFIGEEKNMFLVGSVQDVSKETLHREAISAKNMELERNNAELASFSYIASHDLQEPLRKIQSFIKLISDKELATLTPTTKDYFSRITSAADRMQKLIDALLGYSGIGNTRLEFVAADLNLIVQEVQNNLREVIEEKKATIETDHLPTLNIIELQFHQLFTNLIINAIKYSKPDIPPHIKITADIIKGETIKTEAPVQNEKFWRISITDNGIGFDQQYEHKIFELFQRLHGRSEYQGTGIGLAICKKIMYNHNGFIDAKGKPGTGAVFNIYLPYSK